MNQCTFERYEKKCLLSAAEEKATDWEISDWDRDGTYDAASAVYIQLSGDGVFIDGDGVMVESSTIAIAEEGTYVVSGALDGALHANGDRTIEGGGRSRTRRGWRSRITHFFRQGALCEMLPLLRSKARAGRVRVAISDIK